MRRTLIRFALLAIFAALAGCLSMPAHRPWTAEDLRWVGGQSPATAAADIVAVYTHTGSLTTDVRVDLLDIHPNDPIRLELKLWDNRSFNQEPFTVVLDPTGAVRTDGGGEGRPVIWPRVLVDYDLDTVTFSFNRFLLGNRIRVDISSYEGDAVAPAAQALNVRSDGTPPTQRAAVLLSFWDTFPAETPAQALRRWNGAHTGPLGGRDGLSFLLKGAQANHLPLALLDLKQPSSLGALDTVGAMAQVQALAQSGLLMLPETVYSSPADRSLAFSRQAAEGFSLPQSPFVYSSLGGEQPGYSGQFIRLADAAHIGQAGGKRYFPLPEGVEDEAAPDGPSLNVRQALVAAMLSDDPGDLVSLGGDLPRSTWGVADAALPTLAWLAQHPWIQLLNAEALQAFPARTIPRPAAPAGMEASPWVEALRTAPENSASRLAWLDLLSLNRPTDDPALKALRQDYVSQVGQLLAAAEWAAHPEEHSTCRAALDGSGYPVCVLSNQAYFAVLDPRGGRLTTLFHLDGTGLHQLVAPSSQFAVGLSDPSEWKPENGLAADPSVIAGAFADAPDAWEEYQSKAEAGSILFTRADGRTKSYRLTADGLLVDVRGRALEPSLIPLVVDPERFYFGPAAYRPTIGLHEWTWSLQGGASAVVRSEADLSAQGFVSSYPFLLMAEDPNLDYPRGHYFPFPMSLVTVAGEEDYQVWIGGRQP